MALMNEEVYTALLEAGASDEKARAAARSVAVTDTRFEDQLRQLDQRLAKVERNVAVLRWMIGFNLALTVAVLYRLFVP